MAIRIPSEIERQAREVAKRQGVGWDEEAAQMTEEEREAEDRLWEEIERALIDNRS